MTVPVGEGAGATGASGSPEHLRLPGVLLGAATAFAGFAALAWLIAHIPASRPVLPDYGTWLEQVPRDLVAAVQWALGDVSEPQFYKSWIASAGLLAGAAGAWFGSRAGRRWTGRPISYGSALWPWVLAAAGLSLALSNVAFAPIPTGGWTPTFVPFVCVAAGVVLVYGPGPGPALTGAVLGVLTTPLAASLIGHATEPLGLPAVVACTAAMSIGGLGAFVVCRWLPWMTLHPRQPPLAAVASMPDGSRLSDARWAARRVLVDFSEAQFFANEWASAGLVAGVAVTAVLNPEFAVYGSGLLPQILVAQALTSAVGVIVWRRHFRDGGWSATYASLVSVAPASVLAFDGATTPLLAGAIAGALVCPPIARAVSAALPAHVHAFVGNTLAMAIGTAVVIPALGKIV